MKAEHWSAKWLFGTSVFSGELYSTSIQSPTVALTLKSSFDNADKIKLIVTCKCVKSLVCLLVLFLFVLSPSLSPHSFKCLSSPRPSLFVLCFFLMLEVFLFYALFVSSNVLMRHICGNYSTFWTARNKVPLLNERMRWSCDIGLQIL